MERSLIRRVLVVLVFTALAVPGRAATRPRVLELFTSEGCSSCPPAESLLHELAQRSDILPLSFHVDYWDGLGWRDRFSLSSATDRQRRYGRTLHLNSIYTPQIVIDGMRDVVGSDRREVTKAIGGAKEGVPMEVSVVGNDARVVVGVVSGTQSADVLCVGYLREAKTHIGRGENSGLTLTEANVVRSIEVLGRWDGSAREFKVALGNLPSDVTTIAIVIQAVDQGAIIGASTLQLR